MTKQLLKKPIKINVLRELTRECSTCRGPFNACDCMPLVVTRGGIPCKDQKAALEEFKQACRVAALRDVAEIDTIQ